MMHAATSKGHGHSSANLSGAIASAIRSALSDTSHKKVVVVVTGLSLHDGEYDVEVECIVIDEEEEVFEMREEDDEIKEKEKRILEDFYKADLDAEDEEAGAEEGQKGEEFYHHLMEKFKDIMETNYDLYFSEAVAEEIDWKGIVMSLSEHESYKEKFGFFPGSHSGPVEEYT